MKRLWGWVGAAVLCLAVAVLAARFYIATKAEAAFHSRVRSVAQEIQRPVRVVRYRRHWLYASARTVAVMDDGTRVAIDHRIRYGPRNGWNWASIVSRPDTRRLPELGALFKHSSPLTITTWLPITGGYRAAFVSPAVTGTLTKNGRTARVVWKGLRGRISRHGDTGRIRFSAPHLAFRAPEGTIVLDGLKGRGRGQALAALMRGAAGAWHSDFEVSLAHLAFNAPATGFHLQTGFRAHVNAGATQADTLGYKSTLSVHEFEETPPSSANSPSVHIKTAKLVLSVDGLKLAPIRAMYDRINAYERQLPAGQSIVGDRANQQVGRIALSYLPGILSGAPSLTLAVPQFDTAHGALGGRIKMAMAPAVSGDGSSDGFALAQAIGRAAVRIRAFADRPLVQWWIRQSGHPERVRQQLQSLLDGPMLRVRDNRIETRIDANADTIKLNGVALHLGRRQREAIFSALLSSLMAQ